MKVAAVWGLCQGSGKEPYQTQINLIGPAFHCSCPSRNFPCKHALGLLLLLATAEDQFESAAPPPTNTLWRPPWRSLAFPRSPARPASSPT